MSRRITLCTVTADGEAFNSFNEGYYDEVGGLRRAVEDAQATAEAWRGHHYECEKGVGVAVFGLKDTSTKVLVWWPFSVSS